MNGHRLAAWIVGAALALGQTAFAQQEQDTGGLLAAASDGKGAVRMIWQPPYKDGPWAGEGYTLDRVDGSGKATSVARGLKPGDNVEALKQVLPAQSEAIKRLVVLNGEAAAGKGLESYNGLVRILFLASITDFTFAKAMGLAWEDQPGVTGPVTYRLTGPGGAVIGSSPPMDPRQATPLAGAPSALKAEATLLGVQLVWTRGSVEDALPAPSFRVKRDDGSGFKPLGSAPTLYRNDAPDTQSGEFPLFSDDKPPVEQNVRYTVASLDIFGRETPEAEPVSIFVPDFDAAVAPAGLKAEVGGGSVALTWESKQNPHTTGYLLEKSPFSQGPFAALSQKPFSRSTVRFVDTDIVPGQRLFYRIASLDPRGKAGDPSAPVAVMCRAAGPPQVPQGLEATLGMNVVTLRWQAVTGHLLGYQVQKAPADSENWSPASSRITPEPRFDDPIELGQSGVVRYRVLAIGSDNQASAPSKVLALPLPDNNPPPRPSIVAFDGAGGAVTLSFVPGSPETDSAGFLVLRGGPGQPQMGVITGAPLPSSARTFRDTQVAPGREYIYRVVAVDQAQNHSEPSDLVVVGVGEPALTAPPAPAAVFEAKPFPRVRLAFAAPWDFVAVVVERLGQGDKAWVRVAGPLAPGTTEAVDPNPPRAGGISYRVYYQTLAGAPGPPSEAIAVSVGP